MNLENKMKIGFGYLVYNEIMNVAHLNKFFNSIKHQVRISIHAKEVMQKQLPFMVNYIETIPTTRRHSSLVAATNLLFHDLFDSGCDVVYMMSSDMIPLKQSISFVNNNKYTNIHIQKDPTTSQAKYNLTKYKSLTTTKFKSKISESEWVKQNMFFCMSKKDFYKLKTPSILKSDIFIGFNDGYEDHVDLHDEYYWANALRYNNIDYINNEKYIYCNVDPTKTQSQRFYNIPKEASKYIFLRKYYPKHEQEILLP